MKLLYKPFSIVAGILGAMVGKRAFSAIWSSVSTEPKPQPGEPNASVSRVVTAAAVEGATMAAAGAAAHLLAARIFHYLVGAWPQKRASKDTA